MAINEQSRQEPQNEGSGNRSFYGATGTDPEKSRVQTVKGNAVDNKEEEEDNNGTPPDRRLDNDDDIFDTGFMRSAAFPRPRPGQRK